MPYVECFIRVMPKGAQRDKIACQNAGMRIDQGAVEVKKNGISHDRRIAAGNGQAQVSFGEACLEYLLLSYFLARSDERLLYD